MDGDAVVVQLAIHAQLGYGNDLVVVGSPAAFGEWAPDRALRLSWSDGDVWTGEATIPADPDAPPVEYKLVVGTAGGGFDWEGGDNRVVTLGEAGAGGVLVVQGEFGGDVYASQGYPGDKPGKEKHPTRGLKKPQVPPPPSSSPPRSSPSSSTSPPVAAATREWVGGDVHFMQHRDKDAELRAMEEASRRSRGGDGLEGASKRIADGDRDATSWLRKLELISGLIGQGNAVSLDKVAACGVYLRWISTGTIRCAEDGDHHRPNRMAEVSRDIFINLEAVAGELYKHGPEVGESERQVMRHIHPWLPSFSGEFVCAVPLTRIRDIAHRNDIPQDLKKEIKHTIQNKLHRNAGPEDLVATEAMLQRIQHGGYSQDFVNEFVIFHQELKRFFNCAGALERIDALRDSVDDDAKSLIDELQGAMWALDGGEAGHDGMTGGEGAAILRALRAATAARGHFAGALSTGMRNDAPDQAVVQRQAWRLAEMSLEELAFVVMARAAAAAGAGVEGEGDGGAHFSGVLHDVGSPESRTMWARACEVAAQGLRQMAMSTFRPAECQAVARELEAWGAAWGGTAAGATLEEDALRVRASLQRANRLVEAHVAALVDGYGAVPVALGEVFGLPAHVGATFVDALVRAGVPFQLSRLLGPMTRAAAHVGGLDTGGYDGVVRGVAVGRLVACDRLEPGAVDPSDGPVVALVWHADGDEEASAAGEHIKGVVLARDLPHLSHLAIRARQEKVPLATTEDAAALDAAKQLLGSQVVLRVSGEGVTLAAATEADVAAAATDGAADSPSLSDSTSIAVELSPTIDCRPLSEATVERCGAKAAACGDLVRLAQLPDATFQAPSGVFIPFGAMEACLREAGKADEFARLVAATETAVDPAAIEESCAALRALITSLTFPPELAAQLAASFPTTASTGQAGMGGGAARVVVRSSANVEDLAGMSAAGLYDSVIGVSAGSAREMGEAVCAVWASLYSRRAVMARRAAQVAQSKAHMAVLVQEMVPSSVSFVLHTRATTSSSGLSGSDGGGTEAPQEGPTLEAELAVGLGETLAAGTRGSPWRLEVDQATGTVRTTAFASIGTALTLRPTAAHLGVRAEVVDYSRHELSVDAAARQALGLKLAAVGAALEAEYGAPQDIEGGVVGDQVYVVQSRAQPL